MSKRKDKLSLNFDAEDIDAKPKKKKKRLFEFSCSRRDQDDAGKWHYFVTPVSEYEDLDFQGHDVLINGSERHCEDFYLDDDSHIVIVSESG